MTIKIVAQNLTSEVTEKLISLCSTLILEKGNYGEFTSCDSKFTTTLHLRELYPEIRDMMTLINHNITEFHCGQTEMEVTENFGLSEINVTDSEEKSVEANAESEEKDTIEVQSDIESESETESEPEAEYVAESKSPPEEAVAIESKAQGTVSAVDAKQAVLLMFKDVNGKKSPKEISDEVINHLHLKDHFYKRSFNNISSMIEAYVKAPVKPSSLTGLKELVSFNIYCQIYTKLNSITKQVFMEKYNIEVSFLQCLLYVCEKLADNSDDSQYSEDVVLPPPEKPPDEEVSEKLSNPYKELYEFIQTLNPEITLNEKIKQIVNFMGLQEFEESNRVTVEKLFYSIISNKETDFERLFEFDFSLKKFSTAAGSMMVMKRFFTRFFDTNIEENFVIEFFKDLINNFSEYFPVKKISNKTVGFTKKVSSNKKKQEHGELRCFPKNEDFDTFIRKNVKYKRLNKQRKVHEILKYMGINNLPKESSKIVYKICCDFNVLYIRNSYYLEKLCTSADAKIVEDFINAFAKQLKPDANYITLNNFLSDLRNLP